MSLINQMLQELDARRSEATGNGSFGQQVRAVYEHHRMRPAWWIGIAVALVAVAASVLAWYLLWPHPPAPVVPAASITSGAVLASPVVPATDLPLKFETGLSPVQSVERNPAPQQNRAAEKEDAGTPVASASNSQARRPGPAVPDAASRSSNGSSVPLPDITKLVPRARSMAAQPSGTAAVQVQPPVISKQFKELTPQQRAENEYRKGLASLQQAKGSEAVASLEQALQLDPMHAAARQTLISILLENKHRDGAMRRAREGLAIDGAQPALAMILARLQLEKGELQPALETLERTLPYATDRADYQAFLAALLQRAERHKEAIEHYFLALQKVPQNGVWWMGAAISLQADRRKPEAMEAFKRAKATNTLSPALQEFVDTQLAQMQPR